MRKLETQADGRRFAVEVLRRLYRAGPEKCRANLPPPYVHQCDELHKALAELKERGTVESLCGFSAIFTDLAGTRAPEDLADMYERMGRSGQIRDYKLKRLVSDGHRIAALALSRAAEAADNAESGQPAPAKGPEALTTPVTGTAGQRAEIASETLNGTGADAAGAGV